MTWEELVEKINRGGAELLEISLQPDSQKGWMHYIRSGIYSASYHEGLLVLKLSWYAIFNPFANAWFWVVQPRKDGNPIQIIDATVVHTKPLEESFGDRPIRIHRVTLAGEITRYVGNPSGDEIIHEEVLVDQEMECGEWVLFPDNPTVPLNLSQVRKSQ